MRVLHGLGPKLENIASGEHTRLPLVEETAEEMLCDGERAVADSVARRARCCQFARGAEHFVCRDILREETKKKPLGGPR